MGYMGFTGLLLAAVLLLTGCSSSEGVVDDDAPLTVYATTGYLADAVANIAPDAEVTTMVGPGGACGCGSNS